MYTIFAQKFICFILIEKHQSQNLKNAYIFKV